MKIQDLVGAKVWVKERGAPEHIGYIASVSKPVNLEDIESAIDASIFRILLESGDLVDTAGFNLSKIEHAGYIKESLGGLATDKQYIVRFKSPEMAIDSVIATSVEIRGEHLAFLDSMGELAALFLFEIVESWSELSPTGIRGSPKQRSSFG